MANAMQQPNRRPPQQGQGQGQGRQQLQLNDALETLHAMFSNVERDVIQMVLVEGCQGNMEQAVEALLQMTGGNSANNNSSSRLRQLQQPSQPQPSQQQLPPPPPMAFSQNPAQNIRMNNNNNNNNQPSYHYHQRQQILQQQQPNNPSIQSRASMLQRGSPLGNSQNQLIQSQSQSQSQVRLPSSQQSLQQSQSQSQPSQMISSINLPDDFLRPPSYYLKKYPLKENSILNQDKLQQRSEQEKQKSENEIFSKAIMEDPLFSQDLHSNPEWVLEAMQEDESEQLKSNHNSKNEQSNNNINNNNNNNSNMNSKFSNLFRKRNDYTNLNDLDNGNNNNNNNNNSIDPSDPNARRNNFQQRFNELGKEAKLKLENLAQKLQRNKEEKKKVKVDGIGSQKYSQILTSLDDEPFLEEESNVANANENHRGTYIPPKPSQDL